MEKNSKSLVVFSSAVFSKRSPFDPKCKFLSWLEVSKEIVGFRTELKIGLRSDLRIGMTTTLS